MPGSDTQLSELARHQLDCPVLFGSISEAHRGERGEATRPADQAPARLNDLDQVAVLSEN
ncbi:MAG: hypothetical protein R3E45_13960 [Rhodocyclaceae bacterium]